MNQPRVVVIGGGTGSFSVLSGLASMPIQLSALVNMLDDGGSTGELRDMLDVLPPGDARQCLVAMSDVSDELRELFNFRFPAGSPFSGHSFGNLFLSATELMKGNFVDAVRLASAVLRLRGEVVPVTLDKSHMILVTPDGQTISGQSAAKFHEAKSLRGADILFDSETRANPQAEQAILMADLIVLSPSDLYSSLAPVIKIEGISDALRQTHAKIVYVCNLVNKPFQTVDYGVHDYSSELERLIGGPVIDYVLYNIDIPSEEQLKAYALEGEFPVLVDQLELTRAHYKAVGKKLLASRPPERNANDSFIFRSLIRHDPKKVAKQLMMLI